MLRSCLCSQAQLESETFRAWIERMGIPFGLHRKQWEFAFIAQALHERGMLQPGKRGLGFAVGLEPLSALFASLGCEIVASDLDEVRAARWTSTQQHARRLEDLNRENICDPDLFQKQVSFRVADMNDIPSDLTGFDFVWSSCAFEHLGSIRNGARFIERMAGCLKPSGVAVHTTEFNVSSENRTQDNDPGHVIFRQRDIERMAQKQRVRGRGVDLDLTLGDGPGDRQVDRPPFDHGAVHLKLFLDGFVATSFGMIVEPLGTLPPARKRVSVAKNWWRQHGVRR